MSMISDRRSDREPLRLAACLAAVVSWAATCGAAVMAAQYWFAIALVFIAIPVAAAWQLGLPHTPDADDAVVDHSAALREALPPVNRNSVPRETSGATR